MKKLLLLIFLLVECVLVQGCGGSGSTPAIAVSVTPAVQALDQGATIQFSATVSGTSNSAVTWSVQGPGSITPQGLYTAPASAGNATIVATSVADSSKRATAAVTIREVSVTVAPAQPGELDQGATLQFSATVSGTVNKAVNWSVQGTPASGAITAEGLYTAPHAAGTFQVTATSAADTSKSGAAAVTVRSVSVAIDLGPFAGDDPSVCRDESLQFGVLVSGTVNKAVVWSVVEPGGGTISADGLYTAPAFPGVFTVVATSVSNPAAQGSVGVAVNEIITVQITPPELGVVKGRTRQFTASAVACREGLDESVTWSLEEGSGAGSITDSGLYTAPAGAGGPFHVVATSVADPGQTASAAVTVVDKGFIRTGDTVVRRGTGHTATRLSDGKVLIAGDGFCTDEEFEAALPGCDFGLPTTQQTAEIFDPATGQFAATGQMSVGRRGHAAVLLDDGRVLIFGGRDAGDSAELYDPGIGTFAPAGNLAVPRFGGHSADLLPDGRVLIAGGLDDNDVAITKAEVYDPSNGSFTLLGELPRRQAAHRSTVLPDGKVLLSGGADSAFPCEETNWLASTVVFDPGGMSFTSSPNMQRQRGFHTATLLEDGRVLVLGGFACVGFFPERWADGELLDANLQAWTLVGMSSPRFAHSATRLPDGNVLVAGGFGSNDSPLQKAELFDAVAGVFQPTGSLEVPRTGHRATLLLDGRVLLTGGAGDRTAEVYE